MNELNPERELLAKLLAERAELDQHILFLQKRLGEAGSTPETVALGSPQSPTTFSVERLASSGIQRGEFFGLSRPQAAAALLKKAKQTLTTTEIFEALRETGYDVSGKNALNGLYTALSRNMEIKKVAPNTWGLREWYPHLKEPKRRIPVMTNDDLPPLKLEEDSEE
jgi:hypothetical protein